MRNNIVGRYEEIALFEEKLSSVSAEFIAVYGRRRVGKRKCNILGCDL